MSGAVYMYRPTPGGSSRDTYATFRMRQALRIVPAKSPAEVWAGMSLAARQQACTGALGSRGLQLYALGWGDIPARDRIRIGAEARRVAEGLR